MTTEQQIQAEIDAIDWDAITDQNRLRAIGAELYKYARTFEDLGYKNTVATVGAVMDGFWSNVPERMHRGDGGHIANGYARALMLDVIATLEEVQV